jgi:hypothetical protein
MGIICQDNRFPTRTSFIILVHMAVTFACSVIHWLEYKLCPCLDDWRSINERGDASLFAIIFHHIVQHLESTHPVFSRY